MHVPFVDIVAQSRAVKNEILILWEEILDSGGFVGGKHIAALEKDKEGHCHIRLNGCDKLLEVSRRHLPTIRKFMKR